MPDSTPKAATILLVHGTFARESAWALPEKSSFVRMLLAKLLVQPQIERFEWTGHNSPRARQYAAKILQDRLRQLVSTGAGGPLIVIAHSHGGSILLEALLQAGVNNPLPDIAFFLCTPFLVRSWAFNSDEFEWWSKLLPLASIACILIIGFWELMGGFPLPDGTRLKVIRGPLLAVGCIVLLMAANALARAFASLPQAAGQSAWLSRAVAERLGSRLVLISYQGDEALWGLRFIHNTLQVVQMPLLMIVTLLGYLLSRVTLIVAIVSIIVMYLMDQVGFLVLLVAGGKFISYLGSAFYFSLLFIGCNIMVLSLLGLMLLAISIMQVTYLSLFGIVDLSSYKILATMFIDYQVVSSPSSLIDSIQLPPPPRTGSNSLLVHSRFSGDDRVIEIIARIINKWPQR
jgi:hypothetical protein